MKNLEFLGYPHYSVTEEGEVYSFKKNGYLSSKGTSGNGYQKVTLCHEGERKDFMVHRLVAMAFIPNPCDLPQVNHKDGDKGNNKIDNLEWCTAEYNTQHAMETGLRRREVKNSYRSLSDELVKALCEDIDNGVSNKIICESYNVKHTLVCGIRSGKFYKDISSPFNFRNIPSGNRIEEEKIHSICEDLENGLSINRTRLKNKVSFGVVKRIKSRQKYTYISKNYKW